MIKYKNLLGKPNWIQIEDMEALEMLREDLETCTRVAFDTETYGEYGGLHPEAKVFGCSFALGNDDKIVKRIYWFNFLDVDDKELENGIVNVIRRLFTEGRWNILFHHASFDIRVVRRTWDIDFTHENINDTMVLALVLQNFFKVKLAELTKVVLRRESEWDTAVEKNFNDRKIKEDDRDYSDLPSQLVAGYACEDAQNTFDLFWKLLGYYSNEAKSIQNIYKMERLLQKVISKMEYNGMCVNTDYFVNLKAALLVKQDEEWKWFVEQWDEGIRVIREVKKKTDKGCYLNLNSTQHIGTILFDPTMPNGLCLPRDKIVRTEAGSISIEGDYLELTFPDHPIVQRIDAYRSRESALSKYINPILERSVVRQGLRYIHTNYFPIQTSGRFSSNNINLQNITNDKTSAEWKREFSIRRGFIAPPGYLYVAMDFASFEVAILANASQDSDLIRDLLHGEDFHSRVASIAYHRPYEEIRRKVDKEAIYQRTVSKRTSFLFIYGGGIEKAVNTQHLTVDEAASVKYAIEGAYPEMVRWRRWISDEAKGDGKVFTLCGRKCKVDPDLSYRAVNYVCQGTAADIMKYGHVEVENLLHDRKTRQVATIHDEIHFYWHPDDIDLLQPVIDIMEKRRFDPPKIGAQTYVPMRMEPLMSKTNWSEFKDATVVEIQEALEELKNG